jgi:hypothetical protein
LNRQLSRRISLVRDRLSGIDCQEPLKHVSGSLVRLVPDYVNMKSDNPLSSPEVGRSALFSSVMRRIIRIVWVLAANTVVAWAMFTRLRSVGFPALNFQLCFEFVFEVVLPIVGIALELLNWKSAKWANVGCFAAAGCFWLAAAIWWHSDPFFGVLLIVAVGLLMVAGLTAVVYRATKSYSPDA